MRYSILVPVACFGLAASSMAQSVPRVMAIEAQPLPGSPGIMVGSVDWVAPNHAGGMVVHVNGTTSTGLFSGLWGSLGGGTPGILRGSGPIQGGQVEAMLAGCAGGRDRLIYVGRVVGQPDSLIVDDSIVARVGDPTAPGGGTWLQFAEPHVTEAGEPWFRGRYSPPTGGGVWGLFRGVSLQPVVQPGDVISGLPGGVLHGLGGPDPGHDVSEAGTHWIGVVRNSNGSREAVVLDGQVESAGSVPLVSWNTLPSSFQATPGEAWNHFGQAQILDSRQYAVIGFTPSGILIRNGEVFVRNQQVISGRTLNSDFRAISMNRFGGLAWICAAQQAAGGYVPSVFREQDFLFREGDTVDIDGDGSLDPGNTVYFIPGGEGTLAYTEDGTVWTLAQIQTATFGRRWAVIAVGLDTGTHYCASQLNSMGLGAQIQATGSLEVGVNSLRLRCVDMPLNAFGYFLCSRTPGFVAGAGGSQGDLCLSGSVGRFNAQILNSGATGSVDLGVDLNALPQPMGAVTVMAGETWSFQCWYRDANPSVTSNFSGGIEILMQ